MSSYVTKAGYIPEAIRQELFDRGLREDKKSSHVKWRMRSPGLVVTCYTTGTLMFQGSEAKAFYEAYEKSWNFNEKKINFPHLKPEKRKPDKPKRAKKPYSKRWQRIRKEVFE